MPTGDELEEVPTPRRPSSEAEPTASISPDTSIETTDTDAAAESVAEVEEPPRRRFHFTVSDPEVDVLTPEPQITPEPTAPVEVAPIEAVTPPTEPEPVPPPERAAAHARPTEEPEIQPNAEFAHIESSEAIEPAELVEAVSIGDLQNVSAYIEEDIHDEEIYDDEAYEVETSEVVEALEPADETPTDASPELDESMIRTVVTDDGLEWPVVERRQDDRRSGDRRAPSEIGNDAAGIGQLDSRDPLAAYFDNANDVWANLRSLYGDSDEEGEGQTYIWDAPSTGEATEDTETAEVLDNDSALPYAQQLDEDVEEPEEVEDEEAEDEQEAVDEFDWSPVATDGATANDDSIAFDSAIADDDDIMLPFDVVSSENESNGEDPWADVSADGFDWTSFSVSSSTPADTLVDESSQDKDEQDEYDDGSSYDYIDSSYNPGEFDFDPEQAFGYVENEAEQPYQASNDYYQQSDFATPQTDEWAVSTPTWGGVEFEDLGEEWNGGVTSVEQPSWENDEWSDELNVRTDESEYQWDDNNTTAQPESEAESADGSPWWLDNSSRNSIGDAIAGISHEDFPAYDYVASADDQTDDEYAQTEATEYVTHAYDAPSTTATYDDTVEDDWGQAANQDQSQSYGNGLFDDDYEDDFNSDEWSLYDEDDDEPVRHHPREPRVNASQQRNGNRPRGPRANSKPQTPVNLADLLQRSKLVTVLVAVVVIALLSILCKEAFVRVAAAPATNSVEEAATCISNKGAVKPAATATLQGILAAAPAGWQVVPDSLGLTGPVDFAKALDAEPEAKTALGNLDKTRFVNGYNRSYEGGGNAATIAIYQFSSPTCAADYVKLHEADSVAQHFETVGFGDVATGQVAGKGSDAVYSVRTAKQNKVAIVQWTQDAAAAHAISGVLSLAQTQWELIK